jgi:hypothetical protein
LNVSFAAKAGSALIPSNTSNEASLRIHPPDGIVTQRFTAN